MTNTEMFLEIIANTIYICIRIKKLLFSNLKEEGCEYVNPHEKHKERSLIYFLLFYVRIILHLLQVDGLTRYSPASPKGNSRVCLPHSLSGSQRNTDTIFYVGSVIDALFPQIPC